jgi:PKD repeat protein
MEGFETAGPTLVFTANNPSINGIPEWSYDKTANGRLRFVETAFTGLPRTGIYAATLDSDPAGLISINYLIGTLDMSNYVGASDVEFSFWYQDHGEENQPNDSVWIRGNNTAAWIGVYDLFAGSPTPGVYNFVGGIDLDSILLDNGQVFSSTFQIRFGQEDNFQATSLTVSDGFTFDDLMITGSLPVPDNAGVLAINSPTTPFNPGVTPVEASIFNFGTNNLATVTVNWEVDGNLQTPITYTGPTLTPFTGTPPQVLGAYNFTPGFHDIKVWTSQPNGMTDMDTGNDTMMVSVLSCASLSGTYTVAGAGADYASAENAASALSTCGISGPVVMDITPGTYQDHIELTPIPGASATNTVTFDGGDASTTTLSWAGANGIATVLLQGADYVTIKNLTLENTGTTDAWGVHFIDTASFNIIDSCVINMDPLGTTDVIGVLASSSFTDDFSEGLNTVHNTVSNCTINGGEMGFHYEGEGTTPYSMTGNVILNNTINAPNTFGIYLDNVDTILISGNIIRDNRSTGGDGIYIFDIQNFTITNNQINVPDWGLYIADGNFDYAVSNSSLIANNMIASETDQAGRFDDFENVDVYHNTFYNGSLTGTYFNDILNVQVVNNIFYSVSSDAVEFADVTTGVSGLVFDYNLLYNASGGDLVDDGPTFYPDLASWQASNTALNINSVTGDPVFAANFDDLHLIGAAANDVGLLLPGITTDIDGDTRPQAPSTAVDLGADEYTPLATNAAPISILTPGDFACGDSAAEVLVVIQNLGADPITSMPINATVSGDINVTLAQTYTGNLGAFLFDTVSMGTINTYQGGTFSVDLNTALAGDQDTSDDTLATQVLNAYPVIPSALDDTVSGCGTDTSFLFANVFSGANYAWYDSLTGGNIVGEGDSLIVLPITTPTTFYLAYLSNEDSLTSFAGFSGGNGLAGNMFDVTALTGNVTIDSFDIHIGTTNTETVEIYYTDLPGGYAANAATPANWTLIGTQTVTGNGAGNPTTINAITPLVIPAGQTYGIYITLTTSTNIDYTNGSVGDFDDDGTIRVDYGFGMGYPFLSFISVRVWNGTIYYGSPACSETRVPVAVQPDSLVVADFTAMATDLDLSFTDLTTGGPLTWAWDFGDGSTDNVANPTHSYAFPGTYTITLIVSDDCGTDTTSQEIVVACAAPNASFTVNSDRLEATFVDGSTAGGVTTATYSWDFGDGNTAMMPNPVNLYAAPGSYTVTLIVSDTCGTDTFTQEVEITCPLPSANFSETIAQGTVDFLFAGDTTGVSTYRWNFGDGATSTDQNPSHTFAVSATYEVCLTVDEVCGTDTVCKNLDINVTNIADLSAFRNFSVYPNPTQGALVIEAQVLRPTEVRVSIMDQVGKTIMSRGHDQAPGTYRADFDLSALPAGVYLLRIESEGEARTVKLVRQ